MRRSICRISSVSLGSGLGAGEEEREAVGVPGRVEERPREEVEGLLAGLEVAAAPSSMGSSRRLSRWLSRLER